MVNYGMLSIFWGHCANWRALCCRYSVLQLVRTATRVIGDSMHAPEWLLQCLLSMPFLQRLLPRYHYAICLYLGGGIITSSYTHFGIFVHLFSAHLIMIPIQLDQKRKLDKNGGESTTRDVNAETSCGQPAQYDAGARRQCVGRRLQRERWARGLFNLLRRWVNECACVSEWVRE